MTRRCVIERWVQRKTDQKLIFNGNYTQIVFCVFRIHFHYVLSYLFDLFGVRTCVSILWHTSLPKNATFAWKNSEKPWFWRFLVIFVFLTWRHLWCHCDVIQGMFVHVLVPMDSGSPALLGLIWHQNVQLPGKPWRWECNGNNPLWNKRFFVCFVLFCFYHFTFFFFFFYISFALSCKTKECLDGYIELTRRDKMFILVGLDHLV